MTTNKIWWKTGKEALTRRPLQKRGKLKKNWGFKPVLNWFYHQWMTFRGFRTSESTIFEPEPLYTKPDLEALEQEINWCYDRIAQLEGGEQDESMKRTEKYRNPECVDILGKINIKND